MGDTAAWSHRNRGGYFAAGLEGAPMSASRAQTYIIQSGDTLWEIAYERNLSVETLMRFNPALDAECIQPGERVHIPSSDELLRGMKKKLPRAPLPLQSEFDEQGDLLEDAGDWPPAGSKVHRAIMERHTGDKPPAIAVVAGTIAVAVALRVLARVLRKNGTPPPPGGEATPVKATAVRKTRGSSIKGVIGAVGKCASFVKDTVGKVVVLETESGSLPCTPAPRRQRAPAPAVFRNDTRHSAREEPSQSASYSGGSAVSDASARSTSSAAPSMADILLVVKRAGGGENLTVRSTTRDVAVEIERALVRLARDKTRERERFDRNAPVSGRAEKTLAQDAASVADRAALQQELQAALTAVAAFKEAETIQAAMAAEANARCAALEITLAEERAKVSRLLAQQQARKEKEMAAIEVSAREDIAFQSPQTMTKTAAAPESPAAEAGSPEAQTRSSTGQGGGHEAFRVPLGSVSPVEPARPSSYGGAPARGAARNDDFDTFLAGFGASPVAASGSAAEAAAMWKRQRQAEETAATIHAAAALKAMTAAVEALDAAMDFDAASPESRDVTVRVRQPSDWSVGQSHQSMRYTAAESSSSHGGGASQQDTPGTPPLESDTLSPQSTLRSEEELAAQVPALDPVATSPTPPRVSSGYGGTMAYQASLRGGSGDRSSEQKKASPRYFSYGLSYT